MSDYYKIHGTFNWNVSSGFPTIQLDKTILEIRNAIESSNEPLIPIVILSGNVVDEQQTYGQEEYSYIITAIPTSIYPCTIGILNLPSAISFTLDFDPSSFEGVITEDGRLMEKYSYINELYPEE